MQFGFRKDHSTKTLLLCLLSNIYRATDHSQLTLLALFDVCAAFDTVDHDIVLERFNVSFQDTSPLAEILSFFLGPLLIILYTYELSPPHL